MMFSALFLIGIFSAICKGQYVTEIDDCIINAVNVTEESLITNDNVTGNVCGFLMQAKGYIVIQPKMVNISLDTRIRLFLISWNYTSPSKTFIFEYYGRKIFKNKIFIAEGNQQFALVISSKNASSPIGNFSFLYRTTCYLELIAENFPRFNSPNYYPRIPFLANVLERNNFYSQQCSYKIISTQKRPFSVKFNDFYFPYGFYFYINNTNVISRSTFSFSGQQDVFLNFTYYSYYWYWYYNNYGFNASVELSFDLRLAPINGGDSRTGIPLLQTNDQNFTFQYGSLRLMDAQIMCINLGFGGLESINKSKEYSNLPMIYHDFSCTGPEKRLSQCIPITKTDVYYRNYYYLPKVSTVLSCSENFPIRMLSTGDDQSMGYVQVKVAGSWGYVCPYNMDQFAPDVLCQELGYKGALDYSYSYNYNYYYYYYYYNYDTVMSNIRCGLNTKLKDCYYQTQASYANFWNNYWNNYYNSYRYLYNDVQYVSYYTQPYNYYYYYYYSYCNSGSLQLWCRSYSGFSLTPDHFQGYMKINDSLVCDSDFTGKNGQVYCKAMGYPGVWKSFYNGSIDITNSTFVNLKCTGKEKSPNSCEFTPVDSCPNNQIASVICQTVALAGGGNPSEGRVEVYYKGKKGLLCDDNYDIRDGDVICRQLGFLSADSVYSNAGNMYGYGNGMFLLDNLWCNGDEQNIDQCSHNRWGVQNCWGNDIAGIICVGNVSYCGYTNTTEKNSMSTNGYITTFGANPWQARLIPSFANEWCSATIIGRNWLITSASCFTSSSTTFYITTMSSEYYSNSYNWALTNYIQSTYSHPSYSAITGDYNIALIKLSSTITLNTNVQTACLADFEYSLNGTQCVTTGWNHGINTNNRPLMGKIVDIKSSAYCMSQTNFNSTRMARYLCSDNNMESDAVFNGESGGPLVCRKDGQSTLVGVVGRSIFGARATNLRLYARIDYYNEWIHSVMDQH